MRHPARALRAAVASTVASELATPAAADAEGPSAKKAEAAAPVELNGAAPVEASAPVEDAAPAPAAAAPPEDFSADEVTAPGVRAAPPLTAASQLELALSPAAAPVAEAPAPVAPPPTAAEASEVAFEPTTTELPRPASNNGLAAAADQANDAFEEPPTDLVSELTEVEETLSIEHPTGLLPRDESEVKTRPKIRLPAEGSPKRPTPPPPRASAEISVDQARLSSSLPPKSSARERASPLPPTPSPAGRTQAPPGAPSGEGIVRSSPPPRGPATSFDRDSEVPTRPRIPLTHDMALAAGRITSQEVSPYNLDESMAATRPRMQFVPANSSQTEDPNPIVIVSRARVISDRPPGGGDPIERSLGRPSRRARPDSEEFETLDIEDGVEEPSRLELTNTNGGGAGAKTLETGVRVSRTPPPPPSQPQGRRTGSTNIQAQAGQPARPAPPPPPPTVAAKKAAAAAASAPQQKSEKKKRAWWEVLFSDDYVRMLPRPSAATVAKQVSFMETSLGIKRGDAVLDVGCGLGQHALEFARRGYLVVALDLALSMITRAAEEAQQRGLRINFLHKDIRDIGFEGTFDAIICVGTTFGFFDDEQNRNVLSRLAHALKPGGRLLLDVVNRDFVIGSQPNLVWFEGEGCVVMEESDFNFYSSRLNVKRTMMREDGRQSDSEYSIRLYSVHELGQLLKQTGFTIKEVSGQEATRGLFFGAQSTRVIMLAERKTNTRSREGSTPPSDDS